jgi:hypothetical protein
MGRGAWSRIAALLIALSVMSCGGTGGGPSDSGKQFVFTPRGRLNLAVQTTNDPTKLILTATLLDPQGIPFRNTNLSFRADFADATFIPGDDNTGTVTTDDNGQASIMLLAGLTTGKMRVIADAPAALNISTGITVNLTAQGFVTLGDLGIIPSEVTFVNPDKGTTFDFTATGGAPPYRWSNNNPKVATITTQGTTGHIGHYELTGPIPTEDSKPRTDTVTVQDASGKRSTADVNIIFASCSLEVVPTTLTFNNAKGGEQANIIIKNGVGPFTVTQTFPDTGSISIDQNTGVVTFTVATPPVARGKVGDMDNGGPDTLLIRDSRGCTETVEINVAPASAPTVKTIVLTANPISINGVTGGNSTITATVFDETNRPMQGVSVLFTTDKGSVKPLTASTDSNGEAKTKLTILADTPAGTATVTGTAGGVTGSVTITIVTTKKIVGGPPADIFVDLFNNGSGNNNDTTCTTVLSALVVDAEGNPVSDGTQVDWSVLPSSRTAISSPSFTNQLPTGCDISTYERDTGLKITPQPGDALTCLKYPQSLSGQSVAVTATAVGGSNPTFTQTVLLPPCPFVRSDLTILPTKVDLPAPTSSTVFVIAGGVPPYTVVSNGATVINHTVKKSGGSFPYTGSGVSGTYAVIVTDAASNVVQAQVTIP